MNFFAKGALGALMLGAMATTALSETTLTIATVNNVPQVMTTAIQPMLSIRLHKSNVTTTTAPTANQRVPPGSP